MKLGYPCINRSIGCTANHTFRLASYSKERLIGTVTENIDCLEKILDYNVKSGLLFFRMRSEMVPFASHPVCKFNWADHFRKDFKRLGKYIVNNDIRISMHPDQFVIINSPKKDIVKKSIAELEYHCKVLDTMNLPPEAKIQIHVGGVYGDKDSAIGRFCLNYDKLGKALKKRLVIENNDRLFSLKDCMAIHKKTGIPILFDCFHHECLNYGEPLRRAVLTASKTWKKKAGPLIMDYSEQEKGKRFGTHAESISIRRFKNFLATIKGIDVDVMLEIKDKEKSALKAVKLINKQWIVH